MSDPRGWPAPHANEGDRLPTPAELLGVFGDGSGFVYLASPYSSDALTVRNVRARLAAEAVATFIARGTPCFSPIVHGHAIVKDSPQLISTGWSAWRRLDEIILRAASRLAVLTLDGWEKSEGVRTEIEIAKRLGIPVSFIPVNQQQLASEMPARTEKIV